jgi:hypothetical protein
MASVGGASSAMPSHANLQQYEGAIQNLRASARFFPQFGTNITQFLCYHSTSVRVGREGTRYHADFVDESWDGNRS